MDDEGRFENPQTPRASLPDYRTLAFEPVADAFRGYTVISTLAIFVPIAVAASAISLVPGIDLLPGLLASLGVIGVGLLVGVYRWIDAGYRGWALRDHDIAAREGVLWRRVTTLPFARIQHAETSSGPLERWRGLARLKLYTAGGMTSDLDLIGLDAATADTLREHLAEQIRLRDAATGSEPAVENTATGPDTP